MNLFLSRFSNLFNHRTMIPQMISSVRYCDCMKSIFWKALGIMILWPLMGLASAEPKEEATSDLNLYTGYQTLISTVYYIPFYNLDRPYTCSGNEKKFTVRTTDKKPIAVLCHNHIKNCMMQGSCAVIKDKKRLLLNYRSLSGKEPLFALLEQTECPYGRGPKSVCLEPFYTVAADLNFHKMGDVIYVPELKGITLPNGEIHDGFFIVRDTGGRIKGKNRFDFYTGFTPYMDSYNPFTNAGVQDKKKGLHYLSVISPWLQNKIKTKRSYPMISSEF